MPAYSFKERFIPMLKDGSKMQTIRSKRKAQVKRGDKIYLYYGMRTKYCMKIGEGTCIGVKDVLINKSGTVLFNGKRVPGLLLKWNGVQKWIMGKEADEFAWDDGFRTDGSSRKNPKGAFELMMRFWKQTHSLPFKGDLIQWTYYPLPAKKLANELLGHSECK